MAEPNIIPVPWRLMIRRAQYQIVPIATMIACTVLVGWLWSRNARSGSASGEVNTIRIPIESKVEGLLVELPQPVRVFDTVKKGQVIARLDLDVLDKQVQHLQAEIDAMKQSSPDSPAIKERQAQIAHLTSQLASREIKSPIDGTVTEIRRRAGQATKLGKPIMIIAADRGDYIIGYVRENQGVRPKPGMAVTVRVRGGGVSQRSMQSYVASVAPQVEKLPDRFLRNPNFKEWALAVQIALPPESELKPGEMVDLTFHPEKTP